MEPGVNTDFLYAIRENDFEKLDLLVAAHPGFCEEVKPYGRGLVLTCVLHGSVKTLAYFVEKGCDVNEGDEKGWTPLHAAAHLLDVEKTRYLLSKGAEVNKVDKYGNPPLFRAVFSSRGEDEVVKLLLEYGADPKLESKTGGSPYSLAAESGLKGLVAIFDGKGTGE